MAPLPMPMFQTNFHESADNDRNLSDLILNDSDHSPQVYDDMIGLENEDAESESIY